MNACMCTSVCACTHTNVIKIKYISIIICWEKIHVDLRPDSVDSAASPLMPCNFEPRSFDCERGVALRKENYMSPAEVIIGLTSLS